MFEIVDKFENKLANFFGAPYAVTTDCCTHAIELCLIHTKPKTVQVPTHTYLSIPMTMNKLNLKWQWKEEEWQEYYYVNNRVIDAAVLWRKNSYISGTLMCISFQYRKHLSLGRGGVILLDNKEDRDELIKLGYDGRHRDAPWATQNIKSYGYHYYMTPETAQLGIDKLDDAINTPSKLWSWKDYPDLRSMQLW